MRSQDRLRRFITRPAGHLLAVGVLLFATTVAIAQLVPTVIPQLMGPTPSMSTPPAKPLPKWVVNDQRVMRNFPDQPPVIPHSIEGYELSVNANRCLTCHKREFTPSSGAPMISITHYFNRDGQMLADVSPRRYFCTACHVRQADVQVLVQNNFKDMSQLGVKPAGSE